MSDAGFKILTHDYRSPVQTGGPVLWDGTTVPFELPTVALDRSDDECGAGWNYCADIATAARIAGLWKGGNPSRVLRVRAAGEVVARGDKIRTDRLVIDGHADRATMVQHLGRPFGVYAGTMGEAQVAWWEALARPMRNVRNVEKGLRGALRQRGLEWKIVRYDDSVTAWDAWAARDARAARDAWDAWDAWDARAARDALTVQYAALNKWTNDDPLLLTTGLIDAYRNGLAIVLPTGPNTLGWAMTERSER